MKKLFSTLKDRWTAKTPLVFSRIIKLSMGVSAVAIAIQTALITASAEAPEWWNSSLPYLIGAGAGASTVAKLTQRYDKRGNPIRKTKTKKNHRNGKVHGQVW
jgi:formate-dependent nitrite reductase membrane component NrfD